MEDGIENLPNTLDIIILNLSENKLGDNYEYLKYLFYGFKKYNIKKMELLLQRSFYRDVKHLEYII